MRINAIKQGGQLNRTSIYAKSKGVSLPMKLDFFSKGTVFFGNSDDDFTKELRKRLKENPNILDEAKKYNADQEEEEKKELELEKKPNYCEEKAYKIYSDSRDYNLSSAQQEEKKLQAKNLMLKAIKIREDSGDQGSIVLSKAWMHLALYDDKNREKCLGRVAGINKNLPFAWDKNFEEKLIAKMNETSGISWENYTEKYIEKSNFFRTIYKTINFLGRAKIIEHFLDENVKDVRSKIVAIKILSEDREFKPKSFDIIYAFIPNRTDEEYEKMAGVLTDIKILDEIVDGMEPYWKNVPETKSSDSHGDDPPSSWDPYTGGLASMPYSP